MISRLSLRVFLVACVACTLALPCALIAHAQGAADTNSTQPKPPKQPKSKQAAGQTDTVSSPALSVPVPAASVPQNLQTDLDNLNYGKPLTWAAGSPLHDLGAYAYGHPQNGPASCADASYTADIDRAFIFHIVNWTVPPATGTPPQSVPPQIQSSVWYVYRHPHNDNTNKLVPASITGTGDPLIYGAKHLVILNIDNPNAATQLQSTISAPITQGTSDLTNDISALFSALTGISGSNATAMAATTTQTYPLFAAVVCEDGTAKLPFSVQIADAAAPPGNGGTGGGPAAMAATTPAGKPTQQTNQTSNTAAGSVTCTGQGGTLPCTMGRTYTSKEHAYVDVSAGVSIPGVRDTSFTFTATGASPGATPSVTRHTDAYGLIDLFPLGYFLPKESPVPHVNFGIPVTSQSLHRPYIGLGENLTGWTHLQNKLSLPIAVNAFGGVVFMKTQQLVGTPTTQAAFNADLSTHWVHKGIFGIEVPISSVASKFSKSGGGGGSKGK